MPHDIYNPCHLVFVEIKNFIFRSKILYLNFLEEPNYYLYMLSNTQVTPLLFRYNQQTLQILPNMLV